MEEHDLHPLCAPLAFLLGTWTGEGRGVYPTIADFAYGEEVTFSHTGRPFLRYSQRTWSLETGAPMHAETGYWRPQPGGRLEVVLAHPFGVAEVAEGTVHSQTIRLTATSLVSTSSAKEVLGLERTVEVEADSLRYWLSMATAGQVLQNHLTAELRRV